MPANTSMPHASRHTDEPADEEIDAQVQVLGPHRIGLFSSEPPVPSSLLPALCLFLSALWWIIEQAPGHSAPGSDRDSSFCDLAVLP